MGFDDRIGKHLLARSKFWESDANCRPKNCVLFQKLSLLLGRYNAAVLLNGKLGTTGKQKFFVGYFANTYSSMLRLGDVKRIHASGFNLKNLEEGSFRYIYAHENNTRPDPSKLVCTEDDLKKLKETVNKTDVIESCSRDGMKSKWRFYKFTNVTVFAALVRVVPMCWEDACLPELLLNKHAVNCFTFKENTNKAYHDNFCLFRAPVLLLNVNQKVHEETRNFFNFLMNEFCRIQFQGVRTKDIPVVDDFSTLNNLLYEKDTVDRTLSENLLD